jgi:hypothetical protein
MERLWCLFSHWQPPGYRHQPDPAVLYVRLRADDGLPDYHLYGAGFFPECPEICNGRPPQSLVLPVNPRNFFIKKRPYPFG